MEIPPGQKNHGTPVPCFYSQNSIRYLPFSSVCMCVSFFPFLSLSLFRSLFSYFPILILYGTASVFLVLLLRANFYPSNTLLIFSPCLQWAFSHFCALFSSCLFFFYFNFTIFSLLFVFPLLTDFCFSHAFCFLSSIFFFLFVSSLPHHTSSKEGAIN